MKDLKFHYTRLRDEISYESNLIVQRTSWLVASQAFFFATLALGLDRSVTELDLTASIFFPVIPIVAILVCVFTSLSVLAAISMANKHFDRIQQFVTEHDDFADVWEKPNTAQSILGLLSAVGLPWVFIIVWGYFLFDPGQTLLK